MKKSANFENIMKNTRQQIIDWHEYEKQKNQKRIIVTEFLNDKEYKYSTMYNKTPKIGGHSDVLMALENEFRGTDNIAHINPLSLGMKKI